MYINKWYNRDFKSVYYNRRISDIWNLLDDEDDSVIILREDNTLYNMVSREEIRSISSEISEKKLFEIFDPVDNFLYEDDLVEDALLLMLESKIKILPVVDNEMYPVGIFGIFEVLKAFRNVTSMDEPGTKVMMILDDKPGKLKNIIDILSKKNINILSLITNKIDDTTRMLTLKLDVKNVNFVSDLLENNSIEYEGIFEEDGEYY
ncbi:MAG TPA: CBS domain-containing protein [Tepiditoga sp.]|nr:CBS domain-containing protein [Thermotogota bacterium]HOO75573.1 CBS domain-containing protein [Tepiditoga sp.]